MPYAALDKRSHASTARWADAKRCAGYAVYDPVGQKIGSAEEVFVNRDGEPVYVRVNIGLLFSRTVLIPVQFVETEDDWVMTHRRAGAYAPEVSCRAGANEKPDRKDAAMNRHPAGGQDSLRVA